ncbi:phage major capsid protein [Streptomyces asiaticus]
MSMFNSANAAILPPEYGKLVIEPMTAASVAMQVATVVPTGAAEFHFPRVTSDVTAGWTAEGAAITPSDADTDAYVVTPKKLASLTTLSNELVNDSSPAALQLVGDSIAREMARKLDAAFFGNLGGSAPAGLESLTGLIVVDSGASYTNADPFTDAVMEVEASGGNVTSFVTDPATARTLAKLKQASGSNIPLITPDLTAPSGRVLLGRPLYVSAAVTAGTVWAISKADVFIVLRNGVEIAVDKSSAFASDSTQVRGILRASPAFPRLDSIAKIYDAA